MASNIEHLARKFESQLELKKAARRGTKMSARKINKELDKARKEYKECSKKLSELEKELARLEGDIQACRDGRRGSRSKMLRMNRVLQNMDLSDANYCMFYDDNAVDVGYIIDGEEHYLDREDEGEINLKPMKEYRRELREQSKDEDSSMADDDDDENQEDESQEDDNKADDGFFFPHPNFRFVD